MDAFWGRLALQQRVLPVYRTPFLEALASACAGGLSVFAGQPLPQEQITSAGALQAAQFAKARNRNFLHPGSPLYQCWQDGLLDWLEGWQPDALVVEANPRYHSTPQAVRWMHDRGRPVLGWGLGAPPLHGPLASWRQHSRQKFLRSLDGLIAYSQRGAEEYHRLGMPLERIFVAPNAAAPRPVSLPPPRPQVFLEAPAVLFVGRLQQRKRIDNLLQACASLPAERQPRLWIVGDGPARQELEALAERLYPQAEFKGALYGVELEAYFTQADLFVLPGTGGLAVQQAMSRGLPVIAAEGDGTQDDLVRPANGWRIPANDWQALKLALQEALADPARLRRMGAESYRIVAEEANIEVMVAAFLRALKAVAPVVKL
ncbi:MAG: glycosyltransferase [Anaerolineales bacterium]|nr:glycosyltransferase [Anaerolineales bacterium]